MKIRTAFCATVRLCVSRMTTHQKQLILKGDEEEQGQTLNNLKQY